MTRLLKRRILDKRRLERVLHDVNDVRRILVKLRYTAPRRLLLSRDHILIVEVGWLASPRPPVCTWTNSRSMVRTPMAC